MLDPDATHVRAAARQGGGVAVMRRVTLGMAVGLLVQYGLGMVVNLDVTVPARDHGGGVLVAIGRAFANGPAGLAIHAGLGLLLLGGAIQLAIRSVLARHRPLIWLSSVSLLAILGATLSGAAFVNAGSNGASLGMALLTGVALLCMTIGLYVLGGPARPGDRGPAGG
jgi:hypothetical protein